MNSESELTPAYLGKLLNAFMTQDLPRLNKCLNYYNGKHKILYRKPTDTGKFCNKVVVNYCYNIVQNYLGYLTGVPVKYSNDDFSDVLDVINYNDVAQEDTELLRNALIFGRAFEINYIDEDGKQRFKLLDSRECIPVYANNISNDLKYVVRFYKEDLLDKANTDYLVEVYGPDEIITYRSSIGFSSFEFLSRTPHFYHQCPMTVFKLNENEESIYQQIISLQDAYNQLLSDEIDDFDSFADAYLVLKGAIATEGDLEAMKQNRVLMMDNDASADYLTKSISDTQIQNMLQNINDQIHKISGCPDFNSDKLLAQSGIAMRYKIINFENISSEIEANMRKALQRRIELICTIVNFFNEDEEAWRDVEIVFTRNLPITLDPSTPQELIQYKGIVSTKTLLEQIPFVKNVDEELKLIAEETNQNMELYRFDDGLLEEQGD